jgi:hypothetical protein
MPTGAAHSIPLVDCLGGHRVQEETKGVGLVLPSGERAVRVHLPVHTAPFPRAEEQVHGTHINAGNHPNVASHVVAVGQDRFDAVRSAGQVQEFADGLVQACTRARGREGSNEKAM